MSDIGINQQQTVNSQSFQRINSLYSQDQNKNIRHVEGQNKKKKILQKMMLQLGKIVKDKPNRTINIRRMIDVMNEQNEQKIELNLYNQKNRKIPHQKYHNKNDQRLNNPHSSSTLLQEILNKTLNNNSTSKDFGKKIKNMSKLLKYKKGQIQCIQKQEEQEKKKLMQSMINQKIDQIHSTFNQRSFFSIPHFQNNPKTKHHKIKSNSIHHSEFMFQQSQHNYLITSNKSLQKSKTRIDNKQTIIVNNKSAIKQKINIIKAQEGYINTIKDLDYRKKYQTTKKLSYHTIDPQKTQKWFYNSENSHKKISKLLKQKEQMKLKTIEKSIQIEKNNQLVTKILQKSKQTNKIQNKQFQQIIKLRNSNNKTLIVSNKNIFKLDDYKGKIKKHFQIQLNKLQPKNNSSSILRKKDTLKNVAELLPQIKTYTKYHF